MEHKGNVLMNKYEFGRLLGKGNFAKVYYGRDLKSGQSVAIKVIDKEKILKAGLMDQTKREISVMGLVKHPNVVHFYEVMANKAKIFFIMEHAKGGELFQKVAKGRLKEVIARKYFQQLICAVDFCHKRGVYHRDLKPENLLLDENGNLKVSDFGLSALTESKHHDGLLHTTCGTPAYVAPEVISRRGYDGVKADVWSCGVILFVLLAGYLPFHDSNLMQMYRKISKAEYKCPNWFPSELRRLLCRILDPNPHTRISIAKIMENPWFKKGFNTESLNTEVESKEITPLNAEASFSPHGNSNAAADAKIELPKPTNLNAFDIISLSTGFDLSGLFVENDQKEEAQFTSANPASAVISKLEEIASKLKLKVMNMDGLLIFEESSDGVMEVLSIEIELFEITPSFHLVKIKRSKGDALKYRKVLKLDIAPALKEVVWAWVGEQQHQEQQ
ncbi:CBL-interacting protein kinase 2-like [Diospyros lotus]|uniref:CBL-interacting protein kinase 2-like n=1 Tax=Diospyros lotus TaxID=55363 RepID=UPI00225A8148|nr:CBL-interacting protein kinase 2-like [Diospyros lotus]